MDRGVVVRRAVAAVGVALLVVEAPLVFSSGLVMPLWAVVLLGAIWLVALVLSIRWFVRRPVVVLLLPLAVAAVWFVMVTVGERLLGWQA